MEKIQWRILGYAQIAENHVIPAIHESDLGEVVAIASRNESKAKRTAAVLGIPQTYNS
jgi:xylose dehydrogenase (NAD/NADP)